MKHRIYHYRFTKCNALFTALIFFSVGIVVPAQDLFAQTRKPVPFARYVPQSAKIFLTTAKLGDLDEALTRAHAWDLLPILAGVPVGAGKQRNVPRIIQRFLGFSSTINPEKVAELPIALVAPSKTELGKSVWMIRLPDDQALDRWYPRDVRIGAGGDGQAKFFLTSTGVLVCYRERIASVARVWSTGSILQQTMELMAGRRSDTSLAQSEVYRNLRVYLPEGSIATLYFAAAEGEAHPASLSSSVWPNLDRAMIGLYEGDGRLEISIRGRLATPHPMPKLSAAVVDRFMRLPQTTLFASALTIDPKSSQGETSLMRPTGTLQQYMALLRALQRRDPSANSDALFGPHVIVAWDQDPREATQSPQVAIMIESADEDAVGQQATRIAERVIQLIGWMEPAHDIAPLVVEQAKHLGVRIQHVSLASYAKESKLWFAKLLENTNPAWTVSGGWLIVALNRMHLERILDAQFGLLPTLAGVGDMQPLRRQTTQRAALSILQADLVAQVLDQWVEASESGRLSLLDANWWTGSAMGRPSDDAPFGIEMQMPVKEGVVVVLRAEQGSPAVGHLQPGDRILGVDGQVLSLASPEADLRRGLVTSEAEPGPVLRIERDGALQDISLPRGAKEKMQTNFRSSPTDAVRELASLGRTLQFSTFVVNTGDPQHYSARLTLRFHAAASAVNTKK